MEFSRAVFFRSRAALRNVKIKNKYQDLQYQLNKIYSCEFHKRSILFLDINIVIGTSCGSNGMELYCEKFFKA